MYSLQAADQGAEGELDKGWETVLEVWKGPPSSAVLSEGQMPEMQREPSGSATRGECQTGEASPRLKSASNVLPRSCQEG